MKKIILGTFKRSIILSTEAQLTEQLLRRSGDIIA